VEVPEGPSNHGPSIQKGSGFITQNDGSRGKNEKELTKHIGSGFDLKGLGEGQADVWEGNNSVHTKKTKKQKKRAYQKRSGGECAEMKKGNLEGGKRRDVALAYGTCFKNIREKRNWEAEANSSKTERD